MAERTGTRGGAARPNRVAPSFSVGPVNAPSAGGSAATAWGILARGADQLAQVAHQRYDAQVAVKANEAGVMDAIMGRVRRLDRSTTRGGAYMDAALGTAKTMAETNALVAMQEIYAANPNDPAAIQRGISEYAEGAVGTLAGVDPATAVDLRARIVTQSIPMINGAIANREQEVARIKKEAIAQSEAEEGMVIARHARGIFSDDPQQSSASLAAVLDASDRVASIQSEEASEAFLLSRLSDDHNAAHIVNMQPELKTRLAGMISAAPDGIREGLGIFSGYRSIERQAQLFAQSDRSGRMVARPGSSQHNHGNAADLSWNGKSLKNAPENVKTWVHEHAAEFGLKFPMDYEPWHIETQETRGGEPFTGKIGGVGARPDQQAVNDAVIVPAFKAWFQGQTDKTKAYLDFMAGEIVLPMWLPDNRRLDVNIRDTLSDAAQGAVEQDLRVQIGFENSIREQGEKDSAAEATARSNETRAGFMTGILANGVEMEVGGRKVRAVKPTEEQLLGALNAGDLDAGDYEDLLKATREPRPATTDEDLKRAAFEMILRGEDPESMILENLSRFSVDDAKQMVDYYGTRTNATGTLDATQKFYLDQVDASFTQGLMDDFDVGKQERKVAAVVEARLRMLEGEPAKAVFEDIAARSKFESGAEMRMSPSFPRPRFSVPDPVDGNRINVEETFAALETAFTNGELSDADYLRQKRLLMQWDLLQQRTDVEPEPVP